MAGNSDVRGDGARKEQVRRENNGEAQMARATRCLWVACVSFLFFSACSGQERPEPEFYGMYLWTGDVQKYADDLAQLGVKWLNVGGWERNPSETDAAVLESARRGFHLVPRLFMAEISHDRTMPLNEALTKWRALVAGQVERYGQDGALWKEHPEVKPQPIRYWCIWNEPNIEFLSRLEGLERPVLYAKILLAASEEIRRRDPKAYLIAFNTAGGTPRTGGLNPDGMYERIRYVGWRKFIRDTVESAGTACFDGVATHPYTQPRSPEEGDVIGGLRMVRELAAEQKFADKGIWFTEVGFALEYPRNLNVRDERQQACFMTRLWAIAAAHGVVHIDPMFIEDIIYGPDNSRRSFGFFVKPGQWRQQAQATRVMSRLVPDPRKSPVIVSEEPSAVWAYRFLDWKGRELLMAWSAGETELVREFPVKGTVHTLVSMLGNASSLRTVDGRVTLTLCEAPVYVVQAGLEETKALIAFGSHRTTMPVLGGREWMAEVEKVCRVREGAGAGSDIRSAGWMAAVSRKLGVLDSQGHGPTPGSDEWVRAVHRKAFRAEP